jgi:hypothetical protein
MHHIDAGLFSKRTPTNHLPCPNTATALSPRLDGTRIWRENTVCRSSGHLLASGCQRHPPPPTNHWHPLVLRKGYRHYAHGPRDIGSSSNTLDASIQLLNYAATLPDTAVRFHKSDMRFYIHSDASYLSQPQARSRVNGYFYLGKYTDRPTTSILMERYTWKAES